MEFNVPPTLRAGADSAESHSRERTNDGERHRNSLQSSLKIPCGQKDRKTFWLAEGTVFQSPQEGTAQYTRVLRRAQLSIPGSLGGQSTVYQGPEEDTT